MIHEKKIQTFIEEANQMHAWMAEERVFTDTLTINSCLAKVSAFLARSGAMLVEAKLIIAEQRYEFDQNHTEEHSALKSTEYKKLSDYEVRQTSFAIDKLERINHDLTQQGHNLRKQFDLLCCEMRSIFPPKE